MEGEIGLDSIPGKGSTFWFRLPLPVAPPSTDPAPAAGFLNGLRVLVVDDNATNRLVLESQLRGWRLQPEAVPDAASALVRAREAEAAGEPFDLAVLDLCMAGTDGLELARSIKADAGLADIELIMLTSTMQVNAAEISQAGVREWLMKPVRSSEFYNRLVRLMSTHEPSALASAPAQVSVPQHGPSRARILVVEDNEVNQLVARATVSRLGYAVDVVSNGVEALSATAGFRYAAVLMDCHMPLMDGFEATRRIRQRDGMHPRLPIIAMTAGALDGDRERCLAAGMDDYLAKPVDAAALQATLVRWIPESEAAAVTEPVPQPLAVPGTATSARPAATPALDQERITMLRELGPEDGRGLLPEAAAAFRRDLPARVDALQTAVNDGDGPALARAAHALKGSAANMGAAAVAGICAELEGLGLRGTPDGGIPLLRRLEEELQRLDAELDTALGVAP